jgi:hypothetical protein
MKFVRPHQAPQKIRGYGAPEFVAWPNQSAVTVKGAHFLPEDLPEEVGSSQNLFGNNCDR